MNDLYSPLYSLKEGQWFKLICGASFQDLPTIRNLTLAYTLAGADCLDVAVDAAVVAAAQEGMGVAQQVMEAAPTQGFTRRGLPWLMVSLNDGEDPHFRKAEFDARLCPLDCPRPCQAVCPAQAISLDGVIEQRCYGCGRCLPVCPQGLILARSHVSTPAAIAPLLAAGKVDALEIHTQVGHGEGFQRVWRAIAPLSRQLKLVAISCQDHPQLIDYLQRIYELISPLPCPLIWQTDGRPMSGDLGRGSTYAAIKMAQKVLAAGLPGFVQLAGGTNDRTVEKLARLGLLRRADTTADELKTPQQLKNSSATVSGIAYGSYARSLLLPILEQLEAQNQHLESSPELLWQAVSKAHLLVAQLKSKKSGVEL